MDDIGVVMTPFGNVVTVILVVNSRAGRSPTFQDPGTPLDGLGGTRVPASPIEQVLSFKI